MLRFDNLKLLFLAVSAVYSHKKEQYGLVKVNKLGLRINVETAAKSMQASVLLRAERMTDFTLEAVRGPHTEVAFRVNLGYLLDCLTMFGAATAAVTSAAMSYSEVRLKS